MNNQDRAGGEREAPMYTKEDMLAMSEYVVRRFSSTHKPEYLAALCYARVAYHRRKGTLQELIQKTTPDNQTALTTLQGEVERYKSLLVELAMRGNYALPINEQQDQWFNEGVKGRTDFMMRLFEAITTPPNIEPDSPLTTGFPV